MAIIHSSDLGWKAGQDISSEFAAIAKTFKSGDTFVFDHMYKISGNDINLPNNFTLAGGSPGAGIDITDSATNRHSLIELGSNNTLQDLTVTHSNVPNNDYVNKISIAANGKDNIKVLNSHFEGNVGIMLEIRYGDNLLVQDTEFDGGYYQMRVTSVDGMTIENTLFQNSFGDGIKTSASETDHPVQNATISNSVFLNNGRDGLDTTGGFRDSIVRDSYFVGNSVSGIDLKSTYDSPGDMINPVKNANILITGSEFIDNNAVIVTTNDRGNPPYLNENNAEDRASQNILLENSIVENRVDTNHEKMLHVKDSYNIHWNNVTLLGKVHELANEDRYGLNLPNDVSGTNVTTGSPRQSMPDSFYQDMAGPDWSNISYPLDGPATPPTHDPISYTPPEETPEIEEEPPTPAPVDDPVVEPDPVDEPDPIVIPPTTDTGTNDFPSKLLNIYLAFTDTDTDITQLKDGVDIDSALTSGRPLTIYATSQEGAAQIGSVRLDVDGVESRLENVEPFALFGDNGKGNLWGERTWEDGSYSFTMTAYGGKNGTGKVLETTTFDFSLGGSASSPVVDSPVIDDPVGPVVVTLPPETDLERDAAPFSSDNQLINISLIDTESDTVISDLHQGIKLSNSDIDGNNLTISAEAINPKLAKIGSMKLELDGLYSRVENAAPYALFGDNAEGNFFGGVELSDGTHFATLTAYSGKNGKGSVLEEITVDFNIGDYDSVIVGGTSSAVTSYSSAQDKGTATVSENQMSVELEGSAWKSLNHFKQITEMTVMKVDFKSATEGEIQGIGFSNGQDDLSSTFFQLDGSQELGIQAFNDQYETGSGSDTYIIPVGQFFTGEFDELVLINDDDAGLGASSAFENISFFEAVA